jgi:hypothetical protein
MGGRITVSRKMVSSITLAGRKRTLLSSDFNSGSMEPWQVRAGNWSVKDKQLVIPDSRGKNQAVYTELDQNEALTFVVKVKGIDGRPLMCQLAVFADNIQGDFGHNSVFAQFFMHDCHVGYCENGRANVLSRRGHPMGPMGMGWHGPMPGGGRIATSHSATLRLAYDPATGKATTWIDSNKIDEQTIGPKPTQGRYLIFISRQPSQTSYLRVLQGIVPPSEDELESPKVESETHRIEFSNEDSVSATEVLLTDGVFIAQTTHGQLRCTLEEVTSIVFATKGLEKPRRNKRDVRVETATSRLTLEFKKLSHDCMLGSCEHLGTVQLRRTAIRNIRFDSSSAADEFDISPE